MGNHRHISTTPALSVSCTSPPPLTLILPLAEGFFSSVALSRFCVLSRIASLPPPQLLRFAWHLATVGNTSLHSPRELPCDCHLLPGPWTWSTPPTTLRMVSSSCSVTATLRCLSWYLTTRWLLSPPAASRVASSVTLLHGIALRT